MEALKKWLLEYSEQVRHVDLLIDRAAVLDEQIHSPHAQHLDGMPHGSGRQPDTIGRAVARLDDLREQIAAAEETEQRLYRERDAAIGRITGKRWADWQAVLRLRYLDILSWEDICFSVFGSKRDFDEKADSYKRRTFSLHKEALGELQKINPLTSGRNEV